MLLILEVRNEGHIAQGPVKGSNVRILGGVKPITKSFRIMPIDLSGYCQNTLVVENFFQLIAV